jgi:hypothetical protein
MKYFYSLTGRSDQVYHQQNQRKHGFLECMDEDIEPALEKLANGWGKENGLTDVSITCISRIGYNASIDVCLDDTAMKAKKPVVVLISGKKRSGKDTYATALKEALERKGKTVSVLHFADELKNIVYNKMRPIWDTIWQAIGIAYTQMPDEERSPVFDEYLDIPTQPSPNGDKTELERTALQVMGTEVMRYIDENIHVNLTKRNIEAQDCDYVLIPDTRFPNEITEIEKSYPIVSIRINRPVDTEEARGIVGHPSEVALDSWDDWTVKVENNGTVTELIEEAYQEASVIHLLGK